MKTPAGIALVLAVQLVACQSAPLEPDFSDVERLVSERSGQLVRWDQGRPEDEQARSAVRELLKLPLTSDAALQVAFLRNARLQAVFEQLSIAQADLVQAGALANPTLGIEYRFPGRPSHPLEVHVLEDFMNVATRAMRQRVAETELERVRADVTHAALDLAAEVRTAFVEVQAAQQVADMRSTIVGATSAAADAAARLLEAGNITELDHDIELALDGHARLDLARAQVEVLERRERLTTLMGVWGEDTEWVIEDCMPDPPVAELSPAGLESLAVEQRLDLAAARHEIEAAAREAGLSDATAWVPVLDIGLHSEREPDGSTTIGPSVELPLPFFDSGKARVARARSLLRQRQQAYLALAVEIRSEVRAARARMLPARTRSEYLRDVILPLNERLVEQTQLHYNAMQVGVFQLLQARREQIDAGRDYLEALSEYWLARVALERAVGGRLPASGTATSASDAVVPVGEDRAVEQPPVHQHGDHR